MLSLFMGKPFLDALEPIAPAIPVKNGYLTRLCTRLLSHTVHVRQSKAFLERPPFLSLCAKSLQAGRLVQAALSLPSSVRGYPGEETPVGIHST
jgi:hypothetical protein